MQSQVLIVIVVLAWVAGASFATEEVPAPPPDARAFDVTMLLDSNLVARMPAGIDLVWESGAIDIEEYGEGFEMFTWPNEDGALEFMAIAPVDATTEVLMVSGFLDSTPEGEPYIEWTTWRNGGETMDAIAYVDGRGFLQAQTCDCENRTDFGCNNNKCRANEKCVPEKDFKCKFFDAAENVAID